MYTALLIIHVITCILLVAIVLLQVGRGRGMMGFLGSGTMETMFGSRAGDILTKSTTAAASLFMITSLSLAYISIKKGGSVMQGMGTASKAQSSLPGQSAAQPAADNQLTQKGAAAVKNLKDKLAGKIPNLIKGKEAGILKTTTKSNITYDDKGNKIVDELKYDADGKLAGHSQITYDKLEKEIDRKELPLAESPE